MDIEDIPVNKAAAILGEHYRNYVIIFQDDDEPTGYDLAYSDPYAAKGLLDSAATYHNNYLEAGTISDGDDVEWVEVDEDEENDSDDWGIF